MKWLKEKVDQAKAAKAKRSADAARKKMDAAQTKLSARLDVLDAELGKLNGQITGTHAEIAQGLKNLAGDLQKLTEFQNEDVVKGFDNYAKLAENFTAQTKRLVEFLKKVQKIHEEMSSIQKHLG